MSARYRLVIWWHRKRTGHHTYMFAGLEHVSVVCDCGRTWTA